MGTAQCVIRDIKDGDIIEGEKELVLIGGSEPQVFTIGGRGALGDKKVRVEDGGI